MDEVSKRVAQQYEAHPYPEPVTDLAALVERGAIHLGDPSRYSPLLWPDGRPRSDLNMLVAGCGTRAAALLAFTNPNCRVIGMDLSETSLAHQRTLQETHGLKNLQLVQRDLRDVALLGETFDYICCFGVLHHIADPAEGLRALASVLAPQGAMALLLYSATRRTGVYLLQDLFRRLGVQPNAGGVAFVRRVIEKLPPHHFAHLYIKAAPELAHDAAIVDTFLHAQDRAYTVPQMLDLLRATGLRFGGWVDSSSYYPDGSTSMPAELAAVVAALPDEEQWAALDVLTLARGMHVFTARPEAGVAAIVNSDFANPGGLGLFPSRAPGLGQAPGTQPRFVRGLRNFECTPAEASLILAANGARSIGELAALVPGYEPEKALSLFARLWRLGHVHAARVAYPSADRI
jgi:SAM-dependent methyltransferase